MDDEVPKTGVYATRAEEVVDEPVTLEKHDFGLLGLLGLACIVTCVFTSVLTTLATGLTSGGPVLLLYGLFFAAAGALLIALSLGELASAFPTSRGPMEWTYHFSSPSWRRPLSYFVGQLNWLGYSVIGAGFSTLCASQILALAVLKYPELVVKQYHTWIIAEGFLAFVCVFNIYGMKIMPMLDKGALYFFIFTFFCYLIVPVACANPTLQAPKFALGTFINETGYGPFVAFMVGLSGLTTAFGGTDAISHIAEEVHSPERDIPRTMWLAVVVGFLSTFVLLISLLFAMVDVDLILASPTGMPYVQLVFNATGSFAGTVCMSLLVLAITLLALIGIMLSCSRIAFTVSRDGGLIHPTYFAKVSPARGVPVRAILLTTGTSAALVCTYLGSSTALNSFLNSVMILNWVCYSIPIIGLLLCKRQYARPGPFQLGKFGYLINILTVLYMCFQGIFFVLPYGLPAAVDSMNYSSVVVVGLMALVVLSWYITGRKFYLKEPPVVAHNEEREGTGVAGSFDGKGSEAGQAIQV
ncbi:amino acid/polyamine transporter I [Leucosporidium creatinivorum]|uniref:Amino acid/polyamine transporter I n=1 Tax=Leucosporidium creatinivorum TaxID=106004 RepID=A0A1Y2G3P4_9BASI|nr:amino acid/polyamine transporter I [Leucosporidium creatinivorum]